MGSNSFGHTGTLRLSVLVPSLVMHTLLAFTGFTGTSVWCDPDQQLIVTLLTNRVYNGREGTAGIMSLRNEVADVAFSACCE